ncbi:sensor histidine kinase [Nocardia tengchongensis]|uniref:sensor histidine kinase n=1 Tax=Nocardia tengchongensis TaxID=2055889 RepID=UPI0036C9B4FE
MKAGSAKVLPPGNVKLTPPLELIRPRTIAARLRRILIFSVALVLALLTVIITHQVNSFRDTGETARAVRLALAVQDLVHEIQRERGLTNGLLGGDATARPAIGNQRLATDTALAELNQTLGEQPQGADQVRSGLSQFSGVTANRADVDAGRIDRAASFTFYTNAIAALNQARPGLDHAPDAQLWRGLQSLHDLGDVKEFTAQERGFLEGVFAAGEFAPGEYVKFLDIRAAKQAAVTGFERDATPGQRSKLYGAMQSDESVRAGAAEAVAIASARGPLTETVNPADWWREMSSVIDGERVVQRDLGSEITGRVADLRRDATLVLALYLLAAALAIAAQVWLVVASVRAIVRPLAELAEEADIVAGRRLPQLIAAWQNSDDTDPEPPEPVRADESAGAEIASVASALDRVQTTAYELASAQARLRRNSTESMANLARRNQNLVRRQLGLISEFEREELDPNALSNLFELDHLATRMRRNAESLLVLVGESSPRRWSKPIPLTDVIRAGLSEVDDYRRVVLRRVDDTAIAGAHVSEVAHMLAELIENGLSFSPPDLEVEIYGRRLGARYMIAVVDHGVGMPPDQLATANARLRGEADFLVAPTRFLGHYVVGRLAQRLGVEVELTVSPTSGVVARMLLPAELLGDPRTERPATPEDAKHAAGAQLPPAVDTMPEPKPGRHSSTHATDPDFDTGVAFAALTEFIGDIGGDSTELPVVSEPAHNADGYSGPGGTTANGSPTSPGGPSISRGTTAPGGTTIPGSPAPPGGTTIAGGSAAAGGPVEPGGSVESGGSVGSRSNGTPARPSTIKLVPLEPQAPKAAAPEPAAPHEYPTAPELPSAPGSPDVPGSRTPRSAALPTTATAASAPGTPAAPTAAERLFNGPVTGSYAALRGGAPAAGPANAGGETTGAKAAGVEQVSAGSPGAGADVSGAVPEVQRTRNGLVKRTRKTRGHTGATPGGAQPAAGRPNPTPVADRSPDEIRSILAGFRSGHQRGQGGEPPRPGSRA